MKHYPHHLDLKPAVLARGTVRLPGSKSISNRTLLLAALARGSTDIKSLLASDDTHVMLMALQKLGVHWRSVREFITPVSPALRRCIFIAAICIPSVCKCVVMCPVSF